MRERRGPGRSGMAVGAVVLAIVATGAGLGWASRHRKAEEEAARAALPRATVRRTDLHVTVTAPGMVDSMVKTLIECELENLQMRTRGRSSGSGGSSTILTLVPDGARVKTGDVICTLDSSAYEEMVRTQTIKVGEERAEVRAAELDLESAKLALAEFVEGTRVDRREDFLGRLALAKSDERRQADRLAWSERMARLGYIPLSKLEDEKLRLMRARFSIEQLQGQYDNFLKFTDPLTTEQLQTRVKQFEERVDREGRGLETNEDLLAKFQRMVEHCTIRAPHDGMVVYANEDDDDARVMLGATVIQRQDLFYLPDMSQMEVRALLHESIVTRVAKGMEATIRVEALAPRTVEGRVTDVANFPIAGGNRRMQTEVRNYVGRVKLDNVPAGLMPGMSAEVEIVTDVRPDALVIPAEALATVDGREFCVVDGPDGLERRDVDVTPGTRELLEVTRGLAEGEEVVLHPDQIEPGALPASSAFSDLDESATAVAE